MESLWGSEFQLSTKPKTDLVLNKINSAVNQKPIEKKVALSSKISKRDKIEYIKSEVNRILGTYAENTKVIYSKDELIRYIVQSNANKVIAIDTETNNSLDPISCKLMGLCLYTPEEKQVYVPVNHVNVYGEKLSNQLSESDIKDVLSMIDDDNQIIMHNGKFDYQVILKTCGIPLRIDWDTMIASQLLDENSPAGLKYQYITHIDPSIEKYNIEALFKKEKYEIFPPELFALYAATDAFMTYKLYLFQLEMMKNSGKLFSLFKTVEMPIVKIAAKMELDGVCIDKEYASRLSKKWHKNMDDLSNELLAELNKYTEIVNKWFKTKEALCHRISYKEDTTGKGGVKINGKVYEYEEDLPIDFDKSPLKINKSLAEQFSWPMNFNSAVQLAIFLYDILKTPVVDKKMPRGTGEDIIKQLDYPFCKLLLDIRSMDTVISTFIDKLPESVSEVDGRLHCHFNQLGREDKNVRTGRFSSSDPNLQNIPSGEHSIRLMFTASDGYTMVGADYSAQEPRIMAAYSQDPYLMQSLAEGKDPYATIASGVYKNEYRDNLEFETNEDGSWKVDENGERIKYPDGAHRRKSVKSLLLGRQYNCSTKTA